MSQTELRRTGLDILGSIPWGTHFCNFYKSKEDLLDILVPYFRAGLESHEFCLWVTSEPIAVEDALRQLHKEIPSFDSFLQSRSIEVLPHADWYLKNGVFDPKRIIDGWCEKLQWALSQGFEGMRVNGNEAWLERAVWKDFIEYERALNQAISETRMIVLCAYPLDKCKGTDILDVAHVHEMAVSKRDGKWDIVEVPEIRKTKAQMKKMNDELQHRVQERTHDLQQAIAQLNEEIKEHKRTQESLEIKVTERTRELQNALDKARELAAWKSRFASLVSHEFRTPLATIKISVNHLRRYRTRMKPEAIEAKFKVVLQQVELMVRMLEDLLMLGQAEENKIELTRRKVDITSFFEDLKTEMENVFKRSHTIRYRMDLARKEIYTDQDMLRNIFVNLVSNAIKFSPGKPEVRVDVYDQGNNLRVDIKDNGIGIQKNDMSTIFEPFHRGKNVGGIGGTGLGLSIVKKAVGLLGGTIEVKSKPGEGSVFSVTLPLENEK